MPLFFTYTQEIDEGVVKNLPWFSINAKFVANEEELSAEYRFTVFI